MGEREFPGPPQKQEVRPPLFGTFSDAEVQRLGQLTKLYRDIDTLEEERANGFHTSCVRTMSGTDKRGNPVSVKDTLFPLDEHYIRIWKHRAFSLYMELTQEEAIDRFTGRPIIFDSGEKAMVTNERMKAAADDILDYERNAKALNRLATGRALAKQLGYEEENE